MKRPDTRWLAMLLLVLAPFGASAAQRVDEVLKQHAEHGSLSASLALEQLLAASDRPGPRAPIDLQSRYYFAVGYYAPGAKRTELAEDAVRKLQALAATGRCEPCAVQALFVQGQLAWFANKRQALRDIMEQMTAALPKDEPTRMWVFAYRAGVLESSGELDEAMQSALQAAALAEKLGRHSDHVRALNRLVVINIGRRDLDRAMALSRDAYALAERIGDVENMVFIRNNQGMIHSLRGQTKLQLQALQDVLELATKTPELRDGAMFAQINLSDYHLVEGHFAKAIEHARAGEALALELDRTVPHSIAMHNRAAAMAGLGQREEGIALLKQAIVLGEKAQSKQALVDMYITLSKLYEQDGRMQQALSAARQVTDISTALMKSQREEDVLGMQEKYSAERKDREIERLSLENARTQALVSLKVWQQRMWAVTVLAMLLAAGLLVQWVRRTRRRNRALEVDNAALSEQSSQDPLTGAFNRRHCQRLMGQHESTLLGPAGDGSRPPSVGLMLLDVDFFKRINDQYGHAVGDAVLVEIVARLRGLLCDQDAVVRWGGEEFVLVLPGTSAGGLQPVLERVLEIIGNAPVQVGGQSIPVTASAGCVVWPAFPGQHWEDAMHVADLALYLSKSRGRNRATCLMSIAGPGCTDLVRSNLAQAEVQGDVTLGTVLGPAAIAGPMPAQGRRLG